MIYLDHNATSPLRPQALAAMQEVLAYTGNPYAPHKWGRHARKILEENRQMIASLLGVEQEGTSIIWTSGGTEANNLALQGLQSVVKIVCVGATEHDSVGKVLDHVTRLPVNQEGLFIWDECEQLMAGAPIPFLVSVMLANNETGVIQDIPRLSALVHRYGGYLHTDAIQAVGKIPVSFDALGVDMLSVSAHKCGGPAGIGALIIRDSLPLQPLLRGGGQEWGWRAGTPSVALSAGFSAALEQACAEVHNPLVEQWQRTMEKKIQDICNDAKIFGGGAPRLPNTTCIGMPAVAYDVQVMGLDLEGFAVSAGAACSSGKMAPSAVLTTMGFSDEISQTAIRISSGWNTKTQDIDAFVAAWERIYHRSRGGSF